MLLYQCLEIKRVYHAWQMPKLSSIFLPSPAGVLNCLPSQVSPEGKGVRGSPTRVFAVISAKLPRKIILLTHAISRRAHDLRRLEGLERRFVPANSNCEKLDSPPARSPVDVLLSSNVPTTLFSNFSGIRGSKSQLLQVQSTSVPFAQNKASTRCPRKGERRRRSCLLFGNLSCSLHRPLKKGAPPGEACVCRAVKELLAGV